MKDMCNSQRLNLVVICAKHYNILVASWQNQQNDMCAQRRLRSAWASVQSDQSSLFAQWVAKDPSFLHAESEDWSDWADAQSDLSLRWAHMPVCWFCHEAAHSFLFFSHLLYRFIVKNVNWFAFGQFTLNFVILYSLYVIHSMSIWAASWQIQKNDCAPSENSDQPGHPPNLIRALRYAHTIWVFSLCPFEASRQNQQKLRPAKTQIGHPTSDQTLR